MHQLLRHRTNARLYVPAERTETAFFGPRAPESSGMPQQHSRRRTLRWRADAPSLAIIYDGASVVKNSVTRVRDTGQTRVGYLRAVEQ